MRLFLLIKLLFILCITAVGQTVKPPKLSLEANQAQKGEIIRTGVKSYLNSQNVASHTIQTTKVLNKLINYDFIKIGETFYDLQTNASVGRRIHLLDNGAVSAVWTTSPNNSSGWPERGTGYNYSTDRINWQSPVDTRIESVVRTGWPSIGKLADGSEFVMAHSSNDGGFVLAKNTGQGTTFTDGNGSRVLDDVTTSDERVPIWNRTASSGNNIYTISNYWASEDAGVPVVTINGISSPTTYSKSSDGGSTWDIQHVLLPGYDNTKYDNGGGDTYAIDAKDSIVAICIGGVGNEVAVWKSTNYGQNFTRIIADSFAYTPFDGNQYMPFDEQTAEGRVPTNDGSVDVLIDNDGKIHAFWGLSYVADNDTTEDGYSFWPGTSQLRHWKEGIDSSRLAGGSIDMDANDQLDITNETFASLDATGNLPTDASFAARYGNTSIVSQPSASVDANGTIYVTYSSAIETDISLFNANFRDVLVSYSTDGGLTWNGPQNVTQMRQKEATFGCVAKKADDFLHMIFQVDDIPGTNLQNNGNTGLHPNEKVEIYYAAIPTSEITTNAIGQHTLGSEQLKRASEIFVVNQNTPNPFAYQTDVTIYLSEASDISLKVFDLAGKQVMTNDLGFMNKGNHVITIDASQLNSGIYFYTLVSEGYQVTKKMNVVR
ncbi:MAG: Uncharacterised protein [Bacteroidetes bacterium MED-G17]|nr:MAG: Uncharacterised protein [Bacteroidetes bacterium MED-G17]